MKPILMNTEMVRAILDGRKTVTRRVVKPQPRGRICYNMAGSDHGKWAYPSDTAHGFWVEKFRLSDNLSKEERLKLWTPPCHSDDILYVRETWYKDTGRYMYRANYSDTEKFYIDRKEITMRWRPSIHMPREAARIFLRVTGVRVERLQEIRMMSIWQEGVVPVGVKGGHWHQWQNDYMKPAWDSTIKPADRDRYGWAANPWVWVIEFERCDKPSQRGVQSATARSAALSAEQKPEEAT